MMQKAFVQRIGVGLVARALEQGQERGYTEVDLALELEQGKGEALEQGMAEEQEQECIEVVLVRERAQGTVEEQEQGMAVALVQELEYKQVGRQYVQQARELALDMVAARERAHIELESIEQELVREQAQGAEQVCIHAQALEQDTTAETVQALAQGMAAAVVQVLVLDTELVELLAAEVLVVP